MINDNLQHVHLCILWHVTEITKGKLGQYNVQISSKYAN